MILDKSVEFLPPAEMFYTIRALKPLKGLAWQIQFFHKFCYVVDRHKVVSTWA